MTIAQSLKLEGAVRSVFGRLGEPRRDRGPEFDDELREARIRAARSATRWTEIADDLVPRGRWLVHAETDELFTPSRGAIFQTASVSIIADWQALYFVVGHDSSLRFYERVTSPATYTEHLERQARRERRSGATA